MKTKTKNRRAVASISIVAIAALMIASVAAYNLADAAPSKGEPKGANKTMIGKSDLDGIPNSSGWTTIISGMIKTSNTSDLRVTHFQECAIHTGLKLDAFNEDLTSAIREDVRLVVDDIIIPASVGDEISVPPNLDSLTEGAVTFCGRAFHIETNVLSNVDALCAGQLMCELPESFFDSFIRTKQAHGWEWIVLDLSADTHKVEIQARTTTELDGLLQDMTNPDEAKNVASNTESCMKDGMEVEDPTICTDTVLEVGKRTLIAVEDKLAVGTTLEPQK